MGHDKKSAEFYSQNATLQNSEQRRSKSIIKSSKFDIVVFVEKLRDFFENSKVKEVSLKCTKDKRIAEFINKLQDMSLAEEYYSDCKILTKIIADVKLPCGIKSIIENNISLNYLSEIHKHHTVEYINGKNNTI